MADVRESEISAAQASPRRGDVKRSRRGRGPWQSSDEWGLYGLQVPQCSPCPSFRGEERTVLSGSVCVSGVLIRSLLGRRLIVSDFVQRPKGGRSGYDSPRPGRRSNSLSKFSYCFVCFAVARPLVGEGAWPRWGQGPPSVGGKAARGRRTRAASLIALSRSPEGKHRRQRTTVRALMNRASERSRHPLAPWRPGGVTPRIYQRARNGPPTLARRRSNMVTRTSLLRAATRSQHPLPATSARAGCQDPRTMLPTHAGTDCAGHARSSPMALATQ